jgi:ADP-ribose pyrophosphatase YjhB (NUDIX family)
MITCKFEDGHDVKLRHVVTHAIVEHDNKLLLEKRAGDILETGKWSLPSGFLNRDETAVQGIIREVKEETGWLCKVETLFRIISNPDRPHEDRQNIALEFILKPIKQVQKPDNESSKVEWISIDKLIPFSEFAFDHGESIKLYLEYRKNIFKLPLIS